MKPRLEAIDLMHTKMAMGLSGKSSTEILRKLHKYEGYEKKSYSWLRKHLDKLIDEGVVSYCRISKKYNVRFL